MSLALLDDQQTTAHASAVDAAGNPVPDPNPLTWVVDDATILTLTPSADTQSCTIVTTGKLGVANVTMTDSVLNVSDTFDVSVGVDAPTALSVNFDPPTSRIAGSTPPVVPTPPPPPAGP